MDGKGLWSQRKEVGDGFSSGEPVLKGSSDLSAGGQGNTVFEGRGGGAVLLRGVVGFSKEWGCG